jgi:antibiotic biosynthesis monooxygenase (ABM) superfamily enzyme
MNEPVHIAVTRRVRPGSEYEFQKALKVFIQQSYSHDGVLGAGMLVPILGSDSRDYGILRTFRSVEDRDAFYKSAVFKEWEQRVQGMVEGPPTYRRLQGLEAWFHNPYSPPPPIWKMAVLTWIAVWPVSMAVPAALHPLIGSMVPNVIFAGAVAAGIVVVLTWVAMPLLVKIAKSWLQPRTSQSIKIK